MLSPEDKTLMCDKVVQILNKHEITNDIKILDEVKCLSLFNDLVEVVKSSIDIGTYLNGVEANDKPGIIIQIVLDVLTSNELAINISPELKTQLQNLNQNAKAMNMVFKTILWANEKVLVSFDNNNDGKVTIDEVTDDFVDVCLCNDDNHQSQCPCYRSEGCCKGCVVFSNKVGKLFAQFYIRVICCGCKKGYINYRRRSTPPLDV